jgi:hypothetical protein
MTEAEWLACDDPRPMLRSLCRRPRRKTAGGPGLDPERFRVFAIACARRTWEHLTPNLRLALEHLERYSHDPELLPLVQQLYENENKLLLAQYTNELAKVIGQTGADARPFEEISVRQWAAAAVGHAAMLQPYQAAGQHYAAAHALGLAARLQRYSPGRRVPNASADWDRIAAAEFRAQANLLRDVFGNPFRKVAIDPTWLAWNNRTVARIAEEASAARDPSSGALSPAHLAILADALEEAGCTNQAVLAHLRGPGPHVLGCWVVGALAGRS